VNDTALLVQGCLRLLRTMLKAYYFFLGGNFLDFRGGAVFKR